MLEQEPCFNSYCVQGSLFRQIQALISIRQRRSKSHSAQADAGAGTLNRDCHGQAGLDSQGSLRAVHALHILGDNQTAQTVTQNDSLFTPTSDFHRILNPPT